MLINNNNFSSKKRRLFVALPATNEEAYIGSCLDAIKKQDYPNYKVYICINQPEAWWDATEKKEVCLSNLRTLSHLQNKGFHIIDKASKGRGWIGQNHGVGFARKVLMDAINQEADKDDIIVSLDADTVFNASYFTSIVSLFDNHNNVLALANPYYHCLSGIEALDRAMLRYEIYMRCYALNLWHIGSPYAFTALGSAIALPVSTYRKIGGITPKKSGEDFYFLQKIRKAGKIITWNSEKVYPATRFSDRVFFGTGPALIKGSKGDWNSYPIYHHTLYDDIKKTYLSFPLLFEKDITTPMDIFLNSQLGEKSPWEKLRRNAKSQKTFVNACMQKIDGLRILQYLKWKNNEKNISDNSSLIDFFKHFYKNQFNEVFENFSFESAPIEELNNIRDFLSTKETAFQINDLEQINAR